MAQTYNNTVTILPITSSSGQYTNGTTTGQGLYVNGTGSNIYTIGGVSGNTFGPCGTTTWYGPSVPITTTLTKMPAYVIFKLPKKKVPEMVYLNGKAITIGAFGSKAEAAYYHGQLIFAYNEPWGGVCSGGRITLIIQFKAETYHYVNESDVYGIKLKENSNIMDAELLSVVPRK